MWLSTFTLSVVNITDSSSALSRRNTQPNRIGFLGKLLYVKSWTWSPPLTSFFPPPPCVQWTMGLLKWKDSLFTRSWAGPWTIATTSGCLRWKGCRRRGNWMNWVISVTATSPAVRRGDTEQRSPVCSWRNWRKYSRKLTTPTSM